MRGESSAQAMKAEIMKVLASRADSDTQLALLRAISPSWVKILNAADEPALSPEDTKPLTGRKPNKKAKPDGEKKPKRVVLEAAKTRQTANSADLVERVRSLPGTAVCHQEKKGGENNLRSFKEHLIKKLIALAAAGKQITLETGIIVTRYQGEIPVKHVHLLKDSGCKFYYHDCLEEALKRRWRNITCVNCPYFVSPLF